MIMKNRNIRLLIIPCTIALAITCIQAGYADVSLQARLESSVIRVNESTPLLVTATITGGESLSAPKIPNQEGLQFQYLSQSQQSQFSFSNGRTTMSQVVQWKYEVIALKEGKYTLDNIQIPGESGNPIKANPIKLTVLATSESKPTPKQNSYGVLVTAELNKENAVVGEEIILTYDAWIPPNRGIDPAKIEDQRGQFQGFWTEIYDYGDNRPVQNMRTQDGTIYKKFPLIRYILYPLKPGKYTIPPLTLVCRVPEGGNLSSFPFQRRMKHISVASTEAVIQVDPLPNEGKPDIFQGAVGNFQLEGQVENTEINEGDTITLKVVLRGEGNIRNVPSPILPDLSKFQEFQADKDEEIQITLEGVKGRIQYTYPLLPHDLNANTIGPVRFAYFDPEQDKYQVLSTDPIQLTIHSLRNSMQGMGYTSDRRIIYRIGDDFRFVISSPLVLSTIFLPVYQTPTFWILFVTPIFIIAFGFYWKRRREFLEYHPAVRQSKKAPRQAKRLLTDARKAFQNGELESVFSHLEKAVTDYISKRWDFSCAGMTSQELQNALQQNGVSEDVSGQVITRLVDLGAARFSGTTHQHEAVQSHIMETEKILSMLMKQKTV